MYGIIRFLRTLLPSVVPLKRQHGAVVASKYNLEDAEFDGDRFSNQQGWWEYLESMSWELINKCTFLHLGEDENVSGWTGITADANSSFRRVYRTISTTQHSKSYVFCSTMVAPVQLGTYFLMNLASPFLSKLFHWQRQRYVVREHY